MTAEENDEGKESSPLKSSLSRMIDVDNVIFTLVIDSSGEVVDSKGGLDQAKLRTYGAMCATMFGAGRKANEEIDLDKPDTVVLNDPAGKNYIKGIGRSYILVARTKKADNYDEILREVHREGKFLAKEWMRDQVIKSLRDKYK